MIHNAQDASERSETVNETGFRFTRRIAQRAVLLFIFVLLMHS
jgi:hypothetical protein